MKVKKAIIPAAGLGTHVLPASKAIPKEMQPLVALPHERKMPAQVRTEIA